MRGMSLSTEWYLVRCHCVLDVGPTKRVFLLWSPLAILSHVSNSSARTAKKHSSFIALTASYRAKCYTLPGREPLRKYLLITLICGPATGRLLAMPTIHAVDLGPLWMLCVSFSDVSPGFGTNLSCMMQILSECNNFNTQVKATIPMVLQRIVRMPEINFPVKDKVLTLVRSDQ